jgi:hypothetical protein
VTTLSDLKENAKARVIDAMVLHNRKRYDGSRYLCGYAIEFALKARICKHLQWSSYPPAHPPGTPTGTPPIGDSRFLGALRIHHLETLLLLSGIQDKVKNPTNGPYWSVVQLWKPEDRYESIGTITEIMSAEMIEAAKKLLRVILPR